MADETPGLFANQGQPGERGWLVQGSVDAGSNCSLERPLQVGGCDPGGKLRTIAVSTSGIVSVGLMPGGVPTYSASSDGFFTSAAAVGSVLSVGLLFHPATMMLQARLNRIRLSWGDGSGGTFSVSVKKLTADGSGGALGSILAHDGSDPASLMIARFNAAVAPTRAPGAITSWIIPGTGSGGVDISPYLWPEGKPLIMRAGVAEGWELLTFVQTALTTSPKFGVEFTWTEE